MADEKYTVVTFAIAANLNLEQCIILAQKVMQLLADEQLEMASPIFMDHMNVVEINEAAEKFSLSETIPEPSSPIKH